MRKTKTRKAATPATPAPCCPVEVIAHEADKVIRAIQNAQVIQDDDGASAELKRHAVRNHCVLLDRLRLLQNQASFLRAKSANGALFQLATLAVETEGETDGGEDRIERCIWSIASWLADLGAHLPASTEYSMNPGSDPFRRLERAIATQDACAHLSTSVRAST
jgi:hypothetical protein